MDPAKPQRAHIPSQIAPSIRLFASLVAVENLTTTQASCAQRAYTIARRRARRFDAATMTCHNYSEQAELGLRVVGFTGNKASRGLRPALWHPLRGDSLSTR